MDSIPTTCIPCTEASIPNQNDRSTSRSAGVMAENQEKETRSITRHASDTNRERNQIPQSFRDSSRSVPASKHGACDVHESSSCDNDDRSSMECHENKSKYTDQIFEKWTKVAPKSDQAKDLQTLPVECYPSPGECHDNCESVDTNRHAGAVSTCSWQEYANVGDCDAVKNEVLNNLDIIEGEVEKLRTQALALEEKRTDLLGSLQVLQEARELLCLSPCDREEIEVNANRIICRCLTIDISVSTPRTSNQEKALAKANKVLQTYRNKLDNSESDDGVKLKIQAMLNACITNCDGPVDDKFQALVFDCTADDQKAIRKRLHDLL